MQQPCQKVNTLYHFSPYVRKLEIQKLGYFRRANKDLKILARELSLEMADDRRKDKYVLATILLKLGDVIQWTEPQTEQLMLETANVAKVLLHSSSLLVSESTKFFLNRAKLAEHRFARLRGE